MRPSKFQKPMTSYAEKWGATSMTISNLAGRGCDFDAPDEDVAKWLMTHCKRKSTPMKEAIALVLKSKKPNKAKAEEQRNLEEMRDYYAEQLDAFLTTIESDPPERGENFTRPGHEVAEIAIRTVDLDRAHAELLGHHPAVTLVRRDDRNSLA